MSLTFGEDLWDCVAEVSERVEHSVAAAKDCAWFLGKLASAHNDFAGALRAMGTSYLKDKRTVNLTGSFVEAQRTISEEIVTKGDAHAAYATILSSTAARAESSSKQSAKNLKDYLSGLRKEEKAYADMVSSYEKASRDRDQRCEAAEADVGALKASIGDPSVSDSQRKKLESRAGKSTDRAEEAEEELAATIRRYNEFMRVHYTVTLPRMLNNMQALEERTLELMHNAFEVVSSDFSAVNDVTMAYAEAIAAASSRITPVDDLQEWIDDLRNEDDHPEELVYEKYDAEHVFDESLITPEMSPEEIKRRKREEKERQRAEKQRLKEEKARLKEEKKRAKQARRNSSIPSGASDVAAATSAADSEDVGERLFGNTLEGIMEAQRQRGGPAAQMGIPHALQVLCEGVVNTNGGGTEGIFRVPASLDEVNEVRDQFDEWDFALHTEDALVVGAVLKLFLRSLRDPLIPAEFYDRLIASYDDKQEVCNLMNEIPAINRNVANYVGQFLVNLSVHHEVTLMDLDNLAMVFTPSYLRTPETDDPMLIMTNNEKEKKIITHYLAGLRDGLTPGASAASTSTSTAAAGGAAAAPTSAVDDSGGWTVHFNDEHQRWYYYQAATATTLWTVPEGYYHDPNTNTVKLTNVSRPASPVTAPSTPTGMPDVASLPPPLPALSPAGGAGAGTFAAALPDPIPSVVPPVADGGVPTGTDLPPAGPDAEDGGDGGETETGDPISVALANAGPLPPPPAAKPKMVASLQSRRASRADSVGANVDVPRGAPPPPRRSSLVLPGNEEIGTVGPKVPPKRGPPPVSSRPKPPPKGKRPGKRVPPTKGGGKTRPKPRPKAKPRPKSKRAPPPKLPPPPKQ